MAEIIRHCPDCGSDNSLGQLHAIAGWCPDTAEEYCPEWYCQLCGAALLIGEVPARQGSARGSAEVVAARDRAAVRDRVA
jgi:rubredoxin